jgi:maleylacetate reductase
MQQGIHRYPPMERVIYGTPLAEALAQEIERIGANAVYVLASGTLARQTDVVDRVRTVLGNKLAGVCAKIGAHTPRIDVVAAANAAREAGADALLTVGGGSVTDAAKMVGLCLGNDVTDPTQLDNFRATIHSDGRTERPPVKPPSVRSIAVPTTLSAGEFTSSAGCTDTLRQVKESYTHAQMMPRSVILDPATTVHTPEWLFLSTGIRAVDHAVEDICSINPTPLSDGTSIHALRLLGRGLRAVKADPNDLAARLDCQLGAWMSIMGSQNGVTKGASHGIGHVLGGTAGVPHGYTSCVMLPPVLRFNEPVNAGRQAWVSEALGSPGEKAGDVVAALVASLGLPGTLRDVGVKPEQLDRIAEESMHDRWVHTNPRKIDGPPAVRALLDAAW